MIYNLSHEILSIINIDNESLIALQNILNPLIQEISDVNCIEECICKTNMLLNNSAFLSTFEIFKNNISKVDKNAELTIYINNIITEILKYFISEISITNYNPQDIYVFISCLYEFIFLKYRNVPNYKCFADIIHNNEGYNYMNTNNLINKFDTLATIRFINNVCYLTKENIKIEGDLHNVFRQLLPPETNTRNRFERPVYNRSRSRSPPCINDNIFRSLTIYSEYSSNIEEAHNRFIIENIIRVILKDLHIKYNNNNIYNFNQVIDAVLNNTSFNISKYII